VPPGVFALVLFVAVLHVVWNAVLKSSGDPLRTAERAVGVSVVVFAPVFLAIWWLNGRPGIPLDAAALGVVSGLLETAYFVCLAAAYRRGDLSVVYPIARGTAPLLSVAFGVVLLGERLGPASTVGVVALLAGILIVQQPWRILGVIARAGRRIGAAAGGAASGAVGASSVGASSVGRDLAGAAELAFLTGLMIASYSTVDRVAARLVAPWLYEAVIFPICALTLVAWVRLVADRRRRPGDPPPTPASWRRAGAAGVISLGAYSLVLVAYTLAPLSAVAPLRESAVVIASAWGAIRMGEAAGLSERARRIGGACLVLVGAVLLALEG
jgi:drug/metabolite transporter (DMT)-like permease